MLSTLRFYLIYIDLHVLFLQAICDHTCQFIHCYVYAIYSLLVMYDQWIFRLSEIQSYLGDVLKFPQECHLIGDHKLHKNLLVPYRDNGHMTERQYNYNFCHVSARMIIERAFWLLKRRFRSLLTTLAIDRVDLIPMHILACCILHIVYLMRGDELNIEVNEDVQVIDCVIGNNKKNAWCCSCRCCKTRFNSWKIAHKKYIISIS